ncbi:MAG: SDR family NAD(P)-dependent oxidoreductase [Aliidongia sp.]
MPAAASATSSGFAWIVGVGASAGLGAAIARRFAAGGLTAVVTGRTQAQLDTIVAEIETAGGRAIAAVGDVTREADLQAILAKIEAEGPLEAAIFNAGNNRWKPTLEMETEFFEDLWRVGCLGGFIFGREAARPMVARGRGSLLSPAPSASLRGKPQFTAFAAAKAGLRAVSQSMARNSARRASMSRMSSSTVRSTASGSTAVCPSSPSRRGRMGCSRSTPSQMPSGTCMASSAARGRRKSICAPSAKVSEPWSRPIARKPGAGIRRRPRPDRSAASMAAACPAC